MGGRTGKTINYLGAATGPSESGTPQQIVSQGNAQQTQSNAQVSQGSSAPSSPTVQQG